METNTTLNRIHPLMAIAAVSLTVVSLVGAAAIGGLLPNSRGGTVVSPGIEMTNNGNVPLADQPASIAVEREPVRYKPVVHHEYARRGQTAYNGNRSQQAQVEQAPDYRPTPAYQQPANLAQNSPLGIGIGAVVGGVLGSHVGGGNGRTLAAIAGALGGGYLGNEIAKRNSSLRQQ